MKLYAGTTEQFRADTRMPANAVVGELKQRSDGTIGPSTAVTVRRCRG